MYILYIIYICIYMYIYMCVCVCICVLTVNGGVDVLRLASFASI